MHGRDMYYEKWGFMLIFWNLAGVPLSYCHCTIYLANHDPSEYRWNRFFLAFLYIAYLFVYWVWDTTNSQKNRFRQQERGTMVNRKAFPQLPWQTLKNPKTLTAADGSKILIDGWCKLTSLACATLSILMELPTHAFNRRQGPQDSLHMRSLLRTELGSHHWVFQRLPLVLPGVLRLHDRSSCPTRHSALPDQVR